MSDIYRMCVDDARQYEEKAVEEYTNELTERFTEWFDTIIATKQFESFDCYLDVDSYCDELYTPEMMIAYGIGTDEKNINEQICNRFIENCDDLMSESIKDLRDIFDIEELIDKEKSIKELDDKYKSIDFEQLRNELILEIAMK